MPEHDSIFSFLPFNENLKHLLEALGGKSYVAHVAPDTQHVWAAMLVLLVSVVAFLLASRSMASAKNPAIPDDKLSVRNIVEMANEAVLNMMAGIMGPKAAREFLPLIVALAFYIFISNILGLIPGFQPATANLNTTLAPALVVFLMTHISGLRASGPAYLKHFMGPVWWLAPLFIPIEIISHIARPVSLSLRLLGNIFGDHTAVSMFFVMVPLLIPLPIMLLGVLVAIVQTLVFCLLSTVYIAMAVEHHEEEEGHHGAEAAPAHG